MIMLDQGTHKPYASFRWSKDNPMVKERWSKDGPTRPLERSALTQKLLHARARVYLPRVSAREHVCVWCVCVYTCEFVLVSE